MYGPRELWLVNFHVTQNKICTTSKSFSRWIIPLIILNYGLRDCYYIILISTNIYFQQQLPGKNNLHVQHVYYCFATCISWILVTYLGLWLQITFDRLKFEISVFILTSSNHEIIKLTGRLNLEAYCSMIIISLPRPHTCFQLKLARFYLIHI